MKKTIRIGTIISCNLLILCLLAEMAGLVVYFVREGNLFYFRDVVRVTREPKRTGSASISVHRLQPFWGFSARPNMQRPRLKQSTNNYGFISEVDYPLAREHDRQMIIAIFGGSVAAQFTEYGSGRLKELLVADPRFAGREPVFISFAGGGYKQPQQLQILSYFLSLGQEFDMVVNIDGFNEVALSAMNHSSNIDPTMPSATHFLPLVGLLDRSTLTTEQIDSLHEINRLKNRLESLNRRLRSTRSAALYLARDSWRRNLASRYSHETAGYQKLAEAPPRTSLVAVAGPGDGVDDEDSMFRTVAGRWAEASLLMHQLLSARRIPYIHVLQPNQYYTERIFGEEEKALAIKEDSLLRPHATRGYPYLLEQSSRLLSSEVQFFDATGIFDNEPHIVYADSCCHYNQLGYQLLAEFIGQQLLIH